MQHRRWRHIGVLSVVLAFAFATNAGAATTSKPYSVSISPASIAAGAKDVPVTAMVTNQSSPQSIGSIKFTPPPGITASGAGLILNAGIAPGQTKSFPFTVTASACTAQDAQKWTIQAKQSNDFSGPPGNDFTTLSDAATPRMAVTGSCSLTWTAQPHISLINQPVSNTDFGNAAPWPAVTLRDGTGNPIAGRTITVKLGPKVGTGTMADRLPVTGADGSAQLRPDQGTGAVLAAPGTYSFVASLGTLTAPSSSFPVQAQVKFCPPDCTSSLDSNLASISVTADQTPIVSGGYLSSSLLSPSGSLTAPQCQGYQSISSNWSTIIASTGIAKTATYRISKQDMNRAPQNGAGGLHVCYGEPAPPGYDYSTFDPANPATWWWPSGILPGTAPVRWDSDGDGTPDGALWVLATCKASGGVRPCEQQTFKNGQGDGIIQYLLSPTTGDPMSRP